MIIYIIYLLQMFITTRSIVQIIIVYIRFISITVKKLYLIKKLENIIQDPA